MRKIEKEERSEVSGVKSDHGAGWSGYKRELLEYKCRYHIIIRMRIRIQMMKYYSCVNMNVF